MIGIILAEYEIFEPALPIDDGKGIELMLPDYIVCDLEAYIVIGIDELFRRGHEILDLCIEAHAADAVILIGYEAEELALIRAVIGDGNGGMPGTLVQREHIRKSCIGGKIRVALYKARLVGFDIAHHPCLIIRGLRNEDEGDAAFPCERSCEGIVGYRLHYGGDHGDIDAESRFLLALPVFDKRSAKTYICRYAFAARITGDEQVFAECP